jgi:hypothetical protein
MAKRLREELKLVFWRRGKHVISEGGGNKVLGLINRPLKCRIKIDKENEEEEAIKLSSFIGKRREKESARQSYY